MKNKLLGLFLGLLPGLSWAAAECPALLNHEFRVLAGKEKVRLCEKFRGQVLLVVNTASKCGFTKQYEGLEKLHADLKGKGFAVLGFPSNDFMGQEPGTEQQIQEFCTLTYGVKFPMFEKTTVKGDQTHAFYQGLTAAADDAPDWNFHKYLIGRDGALAGNFGPRTAPEDEALRKAIEVALAKPKPKGKTAKVN